MNELLNSPLFVVCFGVAFAWCLGQGVAVVIVWTKMSTAIAVNGKTQEALKADIRATNRLVEKQGEHIERLDTMIHEWSLFQQLRQKARGRNGTDNG